MRNRREKQDFNSLLICEIMVTIFARLPIKAILQCMRVCRAWRNIILNDISFAKIHLERSPVNLLLCSYSGRNFGLIDFDGSSNKYNKRNELLNLNCQNSYPSDMFDIWGSCNGLLLLGNVCSDIFYICNPIRREFVRLPKAEFQASPTSLQPRIGLGFCTKTNRYKVIKLVPISNEIPKAKCEIYTLGTLSWRSIDDVPVPTSRIVFLNGYFNWVGECATPFIWTFKIDEETLQHMLPPPFEYHLRNMKLGVLDNCLMILERFDMKLQIWVMKNYGRVESWTKDWSVPLPRNILSWYSLQPIRVMDGELLMSQKKSNAIAYYGPEKGILRQRKIFGMSTGFLQMGFVASFISPKNIMMGANFCT